MSYDEIAKACESLTYRDKLRLAQLLVQVGRKEEEEAHPESREPVGAALQPEPELVIYVAERLRKLKPTKKVAVLNCIAAMFQFRGAISEEDREKMFSELLRKKHLTVSPTGRVEYPA